MLDRRPKKNRVHVIVLWRGRIHVANNTWLYRCSVRLWFHLNMWPKDEFLQRRQPERLVQKKLFGEQPCEVSVLDTSQLNLFNDEHFLLFRFEPDIEPVGLEKNAHWLPIFPGAISTRFEQAVCDLLGVTTKKAPKTVEEPQSVQRRA